jgi:hypothetical protein
MYEWGIAERAVSTKPERILTLKPSKFEPSKISRQLFLNQIDKGQCVIGTWGLPQGLQILGSNSAGQQIRTSSYHWPTFRTLGHFGEVQRSVTIRIATLNSN